MAIFQCGKLSAVTTQTIAGSIEVIVVMITCSFPKLASNAVRTPLLLTLLTDSIVSGANAHARQSPTSNDARAPTRSALELVVDACS